MSSVEDDDLPETENEEGEQSAASANKPARLLWAVWGVFLLFALYTLGGIATALLTDAVNPSVVRMQPVSPVEPLDILPPPAAPEPIPYPYEEPQQIEETIGGIQEETPVETPPAPAEEKTEEAPVAPQSHIDWGRIGQSDRPKIAVVIDDMGLNHRNSQRVVALPAALTLAYLPYAERLPKQAEAARAKGHELMVHMPMEPSDMARNNPGPNALLTKNGAEENLRRFHYNMAQFDGYMGVNNHMGSAFTKNAEAIRPVLAALKEKGLWFLDSKTVGSSVAGDIAVSLGIPTVERDVFLDNVATVGAITSQLKQTEAIARKRGYAVAIGHPYDQTIEALQTWMSGLEARGFEIVPLSQIIAARYPDAPVPKYARIQPEAGVEPAAGTETAATVFRQEKLQ